MTLAPGARIGPYEVVALLGTGGMGAVYRATDPRLRRDVAIKVLPEATAQDPERVARFEREARLLASLNHPNIATIYGVEDLGGASAIVMEVVDGPSLADRIARGPIELAECARLASQIADGLASAHARGIVHRDLKPANVLITADDRVKILDLGVAKMVASDTVPTVEQEGRRNGQSVPLETRAGMVLGTPAYMSPEQAAGEPVDQTTDVWAFGAVLFEMLSGSPAFAGRTLGELLVSVLQGNVDWARLPAHLPQEVRALLDQCLACDATRRLRDLRTARDVLRALEIPPPAAPAADLAGTKAILVLPFANLSPEPDTGYFSDGLTDEIITDLSQVRALRVISRTSSMRLKGDPRDPAAIGRALACQYVLEGSVRRAANSLRITARLVDARHEGQLWADKFGGTVDDVFDMQERVSRSIVDAMEIRLTPHESVRIAERRIADPRAHDSYLRAAAEIWSFLPGSLERAISHLQAALQLIGDNVLIYQGLGEAYYQCVNIGAVPGQEAEYLGKAEACADRIFALEPGSPRGHLLRATVDLAKGHIHSSARSFRRVLEAYPNEVPALWLYAHLLGWLGGKPEAAARLAARVRTLDPLNPTGHLVSAMLLVFAGRFAEGVEAARRMFALDPVTPVYRGNLVMALSYDRQLDEAEALMQGVVAEPDSDVGTWWMGLFRAAWRRDRPEVLRLASGPHRQTAMWDAEIPWALASAHAAVNACDEALFWLDRAISGGMINYPFLAEHDWYLDNVREDPRFGPVLARARREWEALET